MIRALIVALAFAPAVAAQVPYDFEQLTGSDPHPFALLDGQDNWSEETFNAANRCGVTATLSHDGSQCLRFQEVGPGYGCDASRINDGNWSFGSFFGNERNAYFEADMLVGFWGGTFGLGYDTSGNGRVRGAEPGELGVRFRLGAQANVQLQLIAADGVSVRVSLANLGIGGGDWVRVRVGMDLPADGGVGTGAVEVMNLSAGATTFSPVAGLQDVPLGLDPSAIDATNPANWNAVWLHFEGATYALDNMLVGSGLARAVPYGDGCGSPALGLRGLGRPVIGNNGTLETRDIPAGASALVLVAGLRAAEPGLDLTAIGMPGCFLWTSPEASAASVPLGATQMHTLSIPNVPTLAGASLYLQSIVVAAGTTPLGVVTSNGVRWILDVL